MVSGTWPGQEAAPCHRYYAVLAKLITEAAAKRTATFPLGSERAAALAPETIRV